MTEGEYLKFMKACVDDESLEEVKKIINNNNVNDIPDVAPRLSPLFIALEGTEKLEIIEYILQQGANPNKDMGKARGSFFPLEYMIGTSMDFCIDGFTKEPDTSIIKLLIKYGANVNAINKNNKTPLDRAIDSKHKPAEELLRNNGAKTSKELEQENQ